MQKDSRIILLKNDVNSGQEITRNKGLYAARGKYITFVDADDVIDENMIEELVNCAEANDVNVVFSTFSAVIDGKEEPNTPLVSSGCYSSCEFTNHILKDISWNVVSCIGSKLYRRDFIEKNNLYFDKQFRFNEDCAYALSALLATDKLYFVNKPFYKYLIRNEGSTMSSYRPGMLKSNYKVVELLKHLFEKHNLIVSKKISYCEMIHQVYVNSLINESKFGDNITFYQVVSEIRNHDKFKLVYDNSKTFGFKHRFFLLLIKFRFNHLLRMIMKIHSRRV